MANDIGRESFLAAFYVLGFKTPRERPIDFLWRAVLLKQWCGWSDIPASIDLS